jgi:hypothetical protein
MLNLELLDRLRIQSPHYHVEQLNANHFRKLLTPGVLTNTELI